MSVEVDVRQYLMTAGITGVSSNNVFIGGVRKAGNSVPHQAVFVLEQSGLLPYQFVGMGPNTTYRMSEVQIRIRSNPNGYLTGKAIADNVWVRMQQVSSASLSTASANYIRAVNNQSAPMYAGESEEEQSEWFLTCRLENLRTA